MPIDETTMKRLVIVKQMFSHGKSHRLNDTEIGNMLACHHYDLSIEMLLKIVTTELKVDYDKDVKFWDLWNQVNIVFKSKFGNDIPLKAEIRPLREARNSVQHSGTIPSTPDIERFESYTEAFLDNVIQTVFDKSLADIKFANLIRDEKLREYLNDAKELIDAGDHMKAIEKLSIAFSIGSKTAREQIFQTSWDNILPPFALDKMKKGIGDAPVQELEDAFKKIEEMLTYIGLGMDYREYLQFKQRSFGVLLNMNGEPRVYISLGKTYDIEDAKICFDFVLNAFVDWKL